LRLAHDLYLTAYRSTAGIYSGINAATTALWLGDGLAAAALAREVHARCLSDYSQCLADLDSCLAGPKTNDGPADDPYWLLATLGEAALLLGEVNEAHDWYARAFEVGKGRLGDLQSTRRQARLLLGSLTLDPLALDTAMPMPKVALFCGNEIERSGPAGRQFSMEPHPDVSTAIERALQQWDIGVGFAAAATGADVLFFEALQARRGIAYAVLPFERDALVADDAGPVAAAGWKQRFEAALRTATQVIAGSGFDVSSEATAIDYAQSLLYGLARIQADALETELVPLAVNDAGEDGPGTPSTIERWRQWGLDVKVIETPRLSMRGVDGGVPALDPVSGPPGRCDPPLWDGLPSPSAAEDGLERPSHVDSPVSSKIVAILFADVKGFSKLDETQVPRFFQHFLGLVAKILSAGPNSPLLRNTWGDGLYLVFDDVCDAGRFALELCERANGTDWAGKGLPGELAIRIALHAGPVWQCNDPVMDAPTFTGTHVSRAARIEPITPSGHVYASQAFAALAAAAGVREMAFEYVGRMPLAKDYGAFPIYHVRRR
ncbi:MAG TPA: hypothetical protein VND64_35175, partial [Pirellulales bacterium]|nr:hypothetical protein [Pirellulales bacterium]